MRCFYFKRFLLIVIVFFVFTKSFLQEDKKSKLIEKKEKIEKEIEITNRLLDDTRNKKKNSLNELKLLNSKIEKRNLLITQLNIELDKINMEIDKNYKLIDSYMIELKKVKDEYALLIYCAFKNRNTEFNFMYLLAAKDINTFYSRYKYLQQYKDYRKERIKLINALNKVIEKKISDLSVQKEKKLDLVNRKLSERAALIQDSDETDKLVLDLKKQEKDLMVELEEKKEISRKLEKEIENLIKEEAKKVNFADLSAEQKILSKNFEDNKGRLPWPTSQGVITNKFGDHPHPIIKGVNVKNNGIDISTLSNSSVKVIFKGKISKIFNIKGANSTVIVQHGNFFTVYHNIINVCVKVGQIVNVNEKIGEVYTDQKTGESILHLEIWKELEKQDPEIWLSN
jgi:septal ring factor EnvC (AmiA/AmiB activator)